MDFVAIDFETSSLSKQFICSCGMVRCINGSISDSYCTLIKPPEGRIDRQLIAMHRITEEMVVNYSEFPDYWEAIQQFIGNMPLVAHSARAADQNFLRKTLNYYHLGMPDYKWGCSRAMARQLFDLSSYGLKSVAAYLDFKFSHHDAIEDARAAATIALYANSQLGDSNFSLFFQQGYVMKPRDCIHVELKPSIDLFAIPPNNQLAGLGIAVTGSFFCLTRAEVERMIPYFGGEYHNSVKKKTNFLVVGYDRMDEYEAGIYTSKMAAAVERSAKDSDFSIVGEDYLIDLIKGGMDSHE